MSPPVAFVALIGGAVLIGLAQMVVLEGVRWAGYYEWRWQWKLAALSLFTLVGTIVKAPVDGWVR